MLRVRVPSLSPFFLSFFRTGGRWSGFHAAPPLAVGFSRTWNIAYSRSSAHDSPLRGKAALLPRLGRATLVGGCRAAAPHGSSSRSGRAASLLVESRLSRCRADTSFSQDSQVSQDSQGSHRNGRYARFARLLAIPPPPCYITASLYTDQPMGCYHELRDFFRAGFQRHCAF